MLDANVAQSATFAPKFEPVTGKNRRVRRAVVLLTLLALAACADKSDPSTVAVPSPSPSSSAPSTVTPTAPDTTAAPATTAAPPPVVWPVPDTTGPGVVVTSTGIVLPLVGAGVADTPCSNQAAADGTPIKGANVVLDPGHGGNEPGAVGPSGLKEKDINLAIAEDVKGMLEAQGAVVVLTRTGDQNTTIKTRAEIATALHPQVFLSIHHNAEPDGPSTGPGNEAYYQIANPDSKRFAGLLWEEITSAFTPYGVAWVADTDHGAKYRPSDNGGDYYGILRRGAGTTTVLSEAAFISNPPEEKLLATEAFRHVEAVAIVSALDRFVTSADPGSGFVVPYPRTEPAGGGGGPEGCTDPAL
jgi:N-acetylmuramoyl-L-alanine amidase